MTPRARMKIALSGGKPDRLPVTTHHLMPSYLRKEGLKNPEDFFDKYQLDPILWINPVTSDPAQGQWRDSSSGFSGVQSDSWKVSMQENRESAHTTRHFLIQTPKGKLTTSQRVEEDTSWLLEPLVKEKKDIELLASYLPNPIADLDMIEESNHQAQDHALVRAFLLMFEIGGQAGCWQDAAVLFGIERLIMETFEDPFWVRSLLTILQKRKLSYLISFGDAQIDLFEHGGGDASSTVISPKIFHNFVAPFDEPIIQQAHAQGYRVVYHTCGGMMPILEEIAAMKPDAMETFTPVSLGGDANLKEARKRLGTKICFLGGFDQSYYFTKATPEETKGEVRRCFAEAGEEGSFILCPSDHFFEARPELLSAFSEEARNCKY